MEETSNKFRFLIPLLSGLFAVIFVLCGVIYIIININLFKEDNIPIIKAPEGPIKEKPEKPGGKVIDHRDKIFYGILDKDIEEQTVEIINPPAPEPELPSIDLGINTNKDIDDNSSKNDSIIKTEDQISKSNILITSNDNSLNNNDLNSVKENDNLSNQKSETNNSNDNKTSLVEKPVSKPKKGYFVQLASFNDEKKAKSSVKILNEKLAVSLGGKSLQVMTVDLGEGKGLWWRVITVIISRNEAETLCAILKSEGNNCIVRSK